MEQLLRVGVITSSHGVRGEAKVYPTTDDMTRFESLKEVMIKNKDSEMWTEVTGVRYSKNLVIAKFACFSAPEEIKKYLQADVLIDRKDAVPLEEGEYYIADLIGSQVVSDEGKELGKIKDVLQTGANDVYLVKGADGKELLFPVIPDCVKNVDIENGIITVHIMPGLLDQS